MAARAPTRYHVPVTAAEGFAMAHSIHAQELPRPYEAPSVRKVAVSAPFVWLQRGARDLMGAPRPGLAVGVVIAMVGLLLAAATWKAVYLAPALLGGFLLVAPLFAIGLYAVSRQLERGEPPHLADAWGAWRGNAGSIAMFGLMLALAYFFWERLAAIVFALSYTGEPLHLSRLAMELMSGRHVVLLSTFLGVGAAVAAVVYSLSVVSAPLLLDRPVDVITATLTSLRCCARNPGPLLLWAALIAALTLLGFATLMVGLVVIFPWLAHASWHAYRDLVDA
jgi:uncharacterized membrane protein